LATSTCSSGLLARSKYVSTQAIQPGLLHEARQCEVPSPSFYVHRPYTFSSPFGFADDWLLPRPEFPKLDGDPLNYRTFINNFEKHIEATVRDNKMRLCYLIQNCEARAKQKIQHFSNIKEQGFELAKSRLNEEYGRSSIIGMPVSVSAKVPLWLKLMTLNL